MKFKQVAYNNPIILLDDIMSMRYSAEIIEDIPVEPTTIIKLKNINKPLTDQQIEDFDRDFCANCALNTIGACFVDLGSKIVAYNASAEDILTTGKCRSYLIIVT